LAPGVGNTGLLQRDFLSKMHPPKAKAKRRAQGAAEWGAKTRPI